MNQKQSGNRGPAAAEGPYRSSPEPEKTSDRRPLIFLGVVIGVAIALSFDSEAVEHAPEIADVPPLALRHVAVFPVESGELPAAVPLEPLLASDSPGDLVIRSPRVGSTRLQRGRPLRIQFNRLMVRRADVGKPLDSVPLQFVPAVAGTAQWTSRSALTFFPDRSAWDRGIEARWNAAPELEALDGSSVVDTGERVVVFDNTPHVILRQRTVSPGAPLPLYFDNRVNTQELSRDVFAYEIGGAGRSVGISLLPGVPDEQGFRVPLRMNRTLEEGTNIAVAIAPRWTTWGGQMPSIARFRIQPPPQLVGSGCAPNASAYGHCPHNAQPGQIVEIDDAFRVMASEALADVLPVQVQVNPMVPEMQVAFSDDARRVVEIRGRFEADQPYEVRFRGLRTQSGRELGGVRPFAIRSRGHAPEVRIDLGRRTFERGANASLYFSAIRPGKGAILEQSVAAGDEVLAALHPSRYAQHAVSAAQHRPLSPIVPEARANVWARGEHAVRFGEDESNMRVVAFRAGAAREGELLPAIFVQETDLAVNVRILATGVVAWVTSLSTGEPVPGARVEVIDGDHMRHFDQRTAEDGVVWERTQEDLSATRVAVRVTHGDDRSVLVVEPSESINPNRLSLSQGGSELNGALLRATAFTERGAYRPGESVRVKAFAREVQRIETSAYIGPIELRLMSPERAAPIASQLSETNALGSTSAEFELPDDAVFGRYRVLVVRPADEETLQSEQILGSAELRVASFREPSFRVDIEAPSADLVGDTEASFALDATYLFGAPLSGAEAEWSLVREGAARYPARFETFVFGPVDADLTQGTSEHETITLDDEGDAEVSVRLPAVPRRQRVVFETEVRDSTGEATQAHRAITLRPADLEVGVRRGDAWVALGEALEVQPIVINAAGEPVGEVEVEASIRREGWHSWWEWSRRGESGYRLRREQDAEVMTSCVLESSSDETELPTCAFEPERAGTYVLIATVRDAEGRTSTSSRRLYVAGPDEAPDRDAPGTPIALTPARPSYSAGENAEFAFESPWDARALVTIESDTLVSYEIRDVQQGGNRISVPLREELVPTAFVSVSILKARTGEPTERHDVNGPDLRVGIAEVQVTPRAPRLELAIEAPSELRPGGETEVRVHVDGAESETEVALWIVDEGILRLTDYETPDPMAGLWPRRSPEFQWDDLRRHLTSRITPDEWRGGGDGGESDERRIRADEPIMDPVAAWLPHLHVDENGEARTTITLPERDTEYRIIALATDARSARGSAEASLVASRPYVVQEAFPRFATQGDRFDAPLIVRGTSDEPIRLPVTVWVDDQVVVRREVAVSRREPAQLSVPVEADHLGVIRVMAQVGERRIQRRIPIAPMARWASGVTLGGGQGERGLPENRDLQLQIPENATGSVEIRVASHPFLGIGELAREVEEYDAEGLSIEVARVLALTSRLALPRLVLPDSRGQGREDLEARLRSAMEALRNRVIELSSYGRSSDGNLVEIAEALQVGAAALPNPDARHLETLGALLDQIEIRSENEAFGMITGTPLTMRARAARLLVNADRDVDDLIDALTTQLDQVPLEGLAALSHAVDGRQRELTLKTMVQRVLDRVRPEPTEGEEEAMISIDAQLAWDELHSADASVLGAMLEALSTDPTRWDHATYVASLLLEQVEDSRGYGWRSPSTSARAIRGLCAFAEVFDAAHQPLPTVMLGGEPIEARITQDGAQLYRISASELAGRELPLGFENSESPFFYSIRAEWSVPVGESGRIARGRRATVHRIYETPTGRVLQHGDHVETGDLIRVRLFVFLEDQIPSAIQLVDPIPAGTQAVQRQFNMAPMSALESLLGLAPGETQYEARAYYAARSTHHIEGVSHEANLTTFSLRGTRGLAEYTYAIRAVSSGQFNVPPAQLEAETDSRFIARSTAFELEVR